MSTTRTWAYAAAIGLAVLAWAQVRQGDWLLYNHSPSIPQGFYHRADASFRTPLARGALVTVRAVDVAFAYAKARHFTDPGDRFIKRVAAAAGDEVCAQGETVRVNRSLSLRRRHSDASGRTLPWWTGCRVLAGDELLLLGDTDDSFDGRYWGPTRRESIEGVWLPLTF
ncbi:MAG: peptidase S26 conserved region [Alphaproteobacteria bacterium]|nr:MAG: peptidase S26 conserved region [Caulobacteraceae bacterium]TPW07351.1 MAG: peptidase S26 conserved region [Alphaproteobacteria bacterium]